MSFFLTYGMNEYITIFCMIIHPALSRSALCHWVEVGGFLKIIILVQLIWNSHQGMPLEWCTQSISGIFFSWFSCSNVILRMQFHICTCYSFPLANLTILGCPLLIPLVTIPLLIWVHIHYRWLLSLLMNVITSLR